jgi:hypothetical protein
MNTHHYYNLNGTTLTHTITTINSTTLNHYYISMIWQHGLRTVVWQHGFDIHLATLGHGTVTDTVTLGMVQFVGWYSILVAGLPGGERYV